jgi:hypothetical protein
VKGHNERRYSTPWLPPGPRLREMIQLIQHIWDVWQNGKRPASKASSTVQPDDAVLQPRADRMAERPDLHRGREPYICRLAGELCDGFLAHPFHSIKYIEDVVRPNIDEGSRSRDANAATSTLSTTAFVITGKTATRSSETRAGAPADRLLCLDAHVHRRARSARVGRDVLR